MLKLSKIEEKQKLYTVGISKLYFPKELWPKGKVEEWYEVIKVKAFTPSEAAQKAWNANGDKWLSLMGSPKASKRKVSLHSNEPSAGVGGKLGRGSPIEVYSG